MFRVQRGLIRSFSQYQQLSYFSGRGSTALMYKTISQQLRETAAKFPNQFAVYSEHEGRRLTYAELLDRVEALAAGMRGLGLQDKARVGVYAPTMLDYYVIQLACSMSDLVLVNINPAYRLHELEYALNKVAVEAVFIVSNIRSTNYEEMMNKLAPKIGDVKMGEKLSDLVPSLRFVGKLDSKPAKGYLMVDDLVKLGASEENRKKLREIEAGVQSEELTNIQFTSGTTGAPKASCLTHFNLLNNGNILAHQVNYTEHDKILCSVPLYHCFGMVMCNLAALCRGVEVLYPHPTFDALASLKVASEKGATSLYGVPTMFIEEINQMEKNPGKFNLKTVRGGIMAGSICPRPLMEKARELLNCRELIIGYGMTETSPLSFTTAVTDPVEKQVSTVGKVLPNTECKLTDPQGKVVPLGQTGEICTRGYMVMQGYWNDQDATAKAIDKDGWMHTGDIGIFDENGYLSIAGRIKDMINRGGEKVFPKEIEEYLLRHPSVFNAQVFAYPDERLGEEVFCWIKIKEGSKLSKEDVLAYCKENIAHYKIPRYLKFVDDFPITVTGKPQKFKMTEAMVQEIKANPNSLGGYRLR
jgi:fatty-acyl-CoA synthase